MDPTRRARLASVIKERLSVLIPREVKDPRVPSVTITNVEVTPDGRQATIRISILGALSSEEGSDEDRERMKECLKGLTSAAGYLRRNIAKHLTVRHVPTLAFKEDRGLDNAMRVHQLLKGIKSENNDRA